MYIPIHKLIYFENLSSLLQPIYLVKYQLSNSLSLYHCNALVYENKES